VGGMVSTRAIEKKLRQAVKGCLNKCRKRPPAGNKVIKIQPLCGSTEEKNKKNRGTLTTEAGLRPGSTGVEKEKLSRGILEKNIFREGQRLIKGLKAIREGCNKKLIGEIAY